MPIQGVKTFRRIRVIINWEHSNDIMACAGRGSVKAKQVHGNKLGGMIERHAFAILDEW